LPKTKPLNESNNQNALQRLVMPWEKTWHDSSTDYDEGYQKIPHIMEQNSATPISVNWAAPNRRVHWKKKQTQGFNVSNEHVIFAYDDAGRKLGRNFEIGNGPPFGKQNGRSNQRIETSKEEHAKVEHANGKRTCWR
jgi:hypothetical protein